MKLETRVVKLPLRHTFTIAHGSATEQDNLIAVLDDGTRRGYGEASAVSYYEMPAATMQRDLEAARDAVENAAWDTPEELWTAMLPRLGHNRFALCALDQAAHDLWGKRLGQPVWRLWGLSIDDVPHSNYTIGIDTIEKMVFKLNEFPGWPVYKIKLGKGGELDVLRALREHTGARFRVDANCGWTAEQTLELAPRLVELGVELIEQPLPADDADGARRLFAECPLPVVADESCLVEEDVDRCAGLFHGINVKLTKCGGMTPARRMIAHARELGLKVMVGCMTESTIGISAIGQLLPLLDWVDMDGAVLLAKDLADGVRLDRGRPVFPDVAGNGVTWTG